MLTLGKPVVSGSYQEYVNGARRSWSVYFINTDAGRAESKRPKQQNDCTVRAVALAFKLPYDEAYELMAKAGRKSWQGIHFRSWADQHPHLKRKSFPAVKGQSRMNPAKFCSEFKIGHWIAQTAKHVFAVIDGVVLDTSSPRPNRCIYAAWEVTGAFKE